MLALPRRMQLQLRETSPSGRSDPPHLFCLRLLYFFTALLSVLFGFTWYMHLLLSKVALCFSLCSLFLSLSRPCFESLSSLPLCHYFYIITFLLSSLYVLCINMEDARMLAIRP